MSSDKIVFLMMMTAQQDHFNEHILVEVAMIAVCARMMDYLLIMKCACYTFN